jgi:hypothetical protein
VKPLAALPDGYKYTISSLIRFFRPQSYVFSPVPINFFSRIDGGFCKRGQKFTGSDVLNDFHLILFWQEDWAVWENKIF